MRILVVEDDTTLGRALQEFLSSQGYAVDWLTLGYEASQALILHHYDLMILDLNLPDMDGLDLLKHLRSQHNTMPVLLLTARDGLSDRVAGLDAGADDYLTKPFELEELAARVRAQGRRQAGLTRSVVEFGSLTLDSANRECLVGHQHLNLSVREFSVLEMLMNRAGKLVTKQQMVSGLSAVDADFTENAVEVYVYRLRKRLEGSGVQIQTVRGFGYLLELAQA